MCPILATKSLDVTKSESNRSTQPYPAATDHGASSAWHGVGREDPFPAITRTVRHQRRAADTARDSVRVSWNDLLILSRQLLAAGDNAPDDLRQRYEEAYARFLATADAHKII